MCESCNFHNELCNGYESRLKYLRPYEKSYPYKNNWGDSHSCDIDKIINDIFC